jgi:hypothetical protein
VRPPEADCLDGADDNGDKLADCADPTCADRVVCVDDPSGGELGIFGGGATCPSPYATHTVYNQNLDVPTTCSGCTCAPWVTCKIDLSFSTANDCSSATTGPSLTATNSPTSSTTFMAPVCMTVSSSNPLSVHTTNTHVSSTCTDDASAAKPDGVFWTSSTDFCAVTRSSQTCGSGKRCVAKPPPGTSQCVRLPTPAASCPSGYDNGGETWYGALQYSDQRTCTCSCAASGGDCNAQAFLALGPSCPVVDYSDGAMEELPAVNWCSTNNYPNESGFDWWLPFSAVSVLSGAGRNATCTPAGAATGPAGPVNGSTICCQ